MTLYTDPPMPVPWPQVKPTLLVCWWCTSFAMTIILFRVAGRYIRSERLFREDWLAFACLIPLLMRMAFVHPLLIYGTNNVVTGGLTDRELYLRTVGSRLVLASRIFYAATLWMLKLTISEFFKRLTLHFWKRSYERMLQFIRWFLLVSFIAVVLSDITECQPITHYWQVVPDPGGRCRQGFVQLITMGTANVITDLLLVVFPIPIIVMSQMPTKRKLQLVALFGGSIIPVGITLYRIPNIIDQKGNQVYRSLWASVEILLATGVANALILGSFVRDRGVKKPKFKYGSVTDSMDRTVSRRGTVARHWGSDEDLVRDLGLSVDPELREEVPAARPAPMAVPLSSTVPAAKKHSVDRHWHFPSGSRSDGESEDSVMKYIEPRHSPGDAGSMENGRKVSFFDVSGLLSADAPPHHRSRGLSDVERANLAHTTSGDPGIPPSNQLGKGSSVFLQDVGGLLTGTPTTSWPLRSSRGHADAMEMQDFAQRSTPSPSQQPQSQSHLHAHPLQRHGTVASLQDVGGLLK